MSFMISRETENVGSMTEVESAFQAITSGGDKPFVTEEELLQVRESVLKLWEIPPGLVAIKARVIQHLQTSTVKVNAVSGVIFTISFPNWPVRGVNQGQIWFNKLLLASKDM